MPSLSVPSVLTSTVQVYDWLSAVVQLWAGRPEGETVTSPFTRAVIFSLNVNDIVIWVASLLTTAGATFFETTVGADLSKSICSADIPSKLFPESSFSST